MEIAAFTRIPCVVQAASITPSQWYIISALLTVNRSLDNPCDTDLDIPLGNCRWRRPRRRRVCISHNQC